MTYITFWLKHITWWNNNQSVHVERVSSPNKLNAEQAKADAAVTELCMVRTELILPATESET